MKIAKRFADKFGVLILAVAVLSVAIGCQSAGRRNGSAVRMPTRTISKNTEKFTIVLAKKNAYDDLQNAQELQQRAKDIIGSADIWLHSDAVELTINYGHFPDKNPTGKARTECKRLKELYKQIGFDRSQFFYISPIPQPDPSAPAAWQLFNSQCAFTLQIGTYYNVPEEDFYDRKALAVEAVKNLRESGETAFFLHGPLESSVYVSCLPTDALQPVMQNGVWVNQIAPIARARLARYEFHYENGAKIYDIGTGPQGEKIRLPRRPALIDVRMLAEHMRNR